MKRIGILIYYQVESVSAGSRFCCTQAAFAAQMRWLRQSGKPLEIVVQAAWGAGHVSDEAIAVTFDDGYTNFHDCALPVLREESIPATLFAVAGKLGGGNDWMPASATRRPLMTKEQLRQLPDWDIAVGSHSLTHTRLPKLDDATLTQELQDNRAPLADVLDQSVDMAFSASRVTRGDWLLSGPVATPIFGL